MNYMTLEEMMNRLVDSPAEPVSHERFMALWDMVATAPALGAGTAMTTSSPDRFLVYPNTSIHGQYNLVCDYLSSLDTRPWWAE